MELFKDWRAGLKGVAILYGATLLGLIVCLSVIPDPEYAFMVSGAINLIIYYWAGTLMFPEKPKYSNTENFHYSDAKHPTSWTDEIEVENIERD